MKKTVIIAILFIATIKVSYAQNINWRSLDEDNQNLIYLNVGYDFGVTTQIGYARTLNSFKPILLSIDYSFPMGENLIDDFKVRFGGQIEIFEKNGFSASAKIYGNFRRYESELVRIASFGSELSILAGYYKTTWHIAGEFGFDKSITSHLKNSDIMRDNYPDIKDGWYIPSGGNFFYGIQGSKKIGKTLDISLRAGLTNAQGKHEDAILPYYIQIGLNKRF